MLAVAEALAAETRVSILPHARSHATLSVPDTGTSQPPRAPARREPPGADRSAPPLAGPWKARRVSTPGRWSAERITQAIRDWHQLTGRVPCSYDWSPATGRALGYLDARPTRWEREHPRWPEVSTVRTHCGSWRAAILAAGFPAPQPLSGTVAERVSVAQRLAAAGETLPAIADHLGVHLNTARRYVRATSCPACGGPKVGADSLTCVACLLARRNTRVFDAEQALEAFNTWFTETGTAPTSNDWTDSKGGSPKWRDEWPRWPSARQVTRLFGTWSAAADQAGLGASRHRYTDEQILAALRDAADRLGGAPTMKEWAAARATPAVSTITGRFGGWRNALSAAGIRRPPPAPTQAEIVDALREFASTHQVAATIRAWRRLGPARPSTTAITAAFGSWSNALQAAGLAAQSTAPDELQALRAFADAHRRAPTVHEWRSTNRRPSTKAIIRRHETWNQALRAAGITPRRRARWQPSEVLDAIRAYTQRHGRPPARDDWIRSDGTHPVARTVTTHFGTWTAALTAALG